MSQAVGCLPRKGMKADRDGIPVENLRKAGAIPILVSNTPELCLCWESNNLITGRSNNPYNLSRTPGGSSGGEVCTQVLVTFTRSHCLNDSYNICLDTCYIIFNNCSQQQGEKKKSYVLLTVFTIILIY